MSDKQITAVFGGALTRCMEFRPGALDNLVTVSRRYPISVFRRLVNELEQTIGRTNADPVADDMGKEWGTGQLMRIGTDGRVEGKSVLSVHKFIPIAVLYPQEKLAFLRAGKPLSSKG